MRIFYSIILVSACVLGFVSCSDDDGYGGSTSSSPYDHVFSGDQLSVYLGNEIIKGVKADVKSEFRDAGDSGVIEDENGNVNIIFDSSFYMTIVLTGFPAAKEKTTLNTILLHYTDISGTVTIKDKSYTYTGEFTGALNHPDNQTLIIHFTVD